MKQIKQIKQIEPIKPILLFIIYILSISTPAPCANNLSNKTNQTNKTNSTNAINPTNQTNSTNQTNFISVDSVLYKLKQKQNITLVDIRKPEEFEKVRIPGSINIPLHAVKTKTYLKLHPVVFVNNGYQYTLLEKECKNLNKKGFKVKILKGGLNCWKQKQGPLAGDVFAQKELNKVFPRTFYQEKNFGNRVVIDVSKKQNVETKRFLPHAVHLPFSYNPKGKSSARFSGKLNRIAKKKPFISVLIFNEQGNGYEKVEKVVEKSSLKNVFYLKGGLKEYKKYLEYLALSHKPKESRLKTVTKCKNCGKEDIKEDIKE